MFREIYIRIKDIVDEQSLAEEAEKLPEKTTIESLEDEDFTTWYPSIIIRLLFDETGCVHSEVLRKLIEREEPEFVFKSIHSRYFYQLGAEIENLQLLMNTIKRVKFFSTNSTFIKGMQSNTLYDAFKGECKTQVDDFCTQITVQIGLLNNAMTSEDIVIANNSITGLTQVKDELLQQYPESMLNDILPTKSLLQYLEECKLELNKATERVEVMLCIAATTTELGRIEEEYDKIVETNGSGQPLTFAFNNLLKAHNNKMDALLAKDEYEKKYTVAAPANNLI